LDLHRVVTPPQIDLGTKEAWGPHEIVYQKASYRDDG
jgi:hypothetical protein